MSDTLTVDEFEAAVDAEMEAQQEPVEEAAEDQPAEEAAEKQPDPPSIDELRAYHYEQIREMNGRVSEALLDFEDSNATTKSLKKRYENLSAQLVDLISRDPLQHQLPFGDDDNQPQANAAQDLWRCQPVSVLGLPESLNEKLQGHTPTLATLGDLQDFWAKGGDLQDISGVGEEKAAAVSDAFAAYGVEHPELYGEQESEPEQETAAEESAEAEATEDADGAADTEEDAAS